VHPELPLRLARPENTCKTVTVPACFEASDVNDDGTLNIADPTYLLGYLFAQKDPPPAPFEACGVDPQPADPPHAPLGCITYRRTSARDDVATTRVSLESVSQPTAGASTRSGIMKTISILGVLAVLAVFAGLASGADSNLAPLGTATQSSEYGAECSPPVTASTGIWTVSPIRADTIRIRIRGGSGTAREADISRIVLHNGATAGNGACATSPSSFWTAATRRPIDRRTF